MTQKHVEVHGAACVLHALPMKVVALGKATDRSMRSSPMDFGSKRKDNMDTATILDLVGFQIARSEAKGQRLPAWMVTSDKSKQEYRDKAVQQINKITGRSLTRQMTAPEATLMLAGNPEMAKMLEQWKQGELELQKARDGGDPTAFFVPEA